MDQEEDTTPKTPRREVGTPQSSVNADDDDSLRLQLNAPSRNMGGEGDHRIQKTSISSTSKVKLEFPDLPFMGGLGGRDSLSRRGYALKRKRQERETSPKDNVILKGDRKAFRPICDDDNDDP